MSSQNSQILDKYVVHCQKRVEAILKEHFSSLVLSNKLLDAMRYACLNGGKRIRPILVYASARAVDANLDNSDAAACAVELIHSYSLIHDDLPAMDDDDLRRGKPSVHKAFDEATAILAGDALQALAFQVLSNQSNELSSAAKLQMIAVLSEASGPFGMTGGQSLDLEASGNDIGLDHLETLHKLKTGALIKASVKMGALCNSQIETCQLQLLERYAENIGLAFQVQDDILDEISDTATLGKPQGSDKAQSKTTYVSLLGLERAKSKANELAIRAIKSLDQFSASADILRDLATFVVNRTN